MLLLEYARDLDKAREQGPGYSVEDTIHRALTFHPAIASKIWTLEVQVNTQLKNSAGRANYRERLIELHLGTIRSGPAAIRECLLHEIAHFMEKYAFGTSGHGQGWAMMMAQLGQVPWENRYHSLPQASKRAKVSLEDLGL